MQPPLLNQSLGSVLAARIARALSAIALAVCLAPFATHAAPVIEVPYLNVFTNAALNGSWPYAALVQGDGGVLFGSTVRGGPSDVGVLFHINPDGTGFSIMHYFGATTNDGANYPQPTDNPIENSGNQGGLLLARDGRLYGVTYSGGTNGHGTLYTINQNGTDYRVLHSFSAAEGGPMAAVTQLADGTLYGTTYLDSADGVVYKINTDGSGYTVLKTPLSCYSGAIQASNGSLYGTTKDSVFRIDTDGNHYTNLYTFTASSNGLRPLGTLVQAANGSLFGTCFAGGSAGLGVIYKINPDGTGFEVVHNFGDGVTPNEGVQTTSGLVLGLGGYFYGTTFRGGSSGTLGSSVYQIAQDGTGYQQLYAFISANDVTEVHGAPCVGTSGGTSGVLFGSGIYSASNPNGGLFALVVNPPVSITPVTGGGGSNQVAVFWPSWAQGFKLQTATDLAGTWSDVTNATPVVGAQVPASGTNQFFRLVAP